MWWNANENCEAILGGQNAGFALLFQKAVRNAVKTRAKHQLCPCDFCGSILIPEMETNHDTTNDHDQPKDTYGT